MKTSTIAFLHTSPAHIPTFEGLLVHDNVQLTHSVREDWLAEAQSSGLSEALTNTITKHLQSLATESDAVICTCSSLGPVVQQLNLPTVFRVDQPMMTQAVQHPPVLLAMCLPSTEAASSELLVNAFRQAGLAADFRCLQCKNAWQHFENNDHRRFGQAVAADIKQAIADPEAVGCVVLAQASMAAAQPFLEDIGVPVYASPALAAAQALEIATNA